MRAGRVNRTAAVCLILLAACTEPEAGATPVAAPAPQRAALPAETVLAETRSVDLRARVAMDRAVATAPALAARLQAEAPLLIEAFRTEAQDESARLAAAGVPRPRPYELDVVWRLEARAGDWVSVLRETRRTTGRAREAVSFAGELFHGAEAVPAPEAVSPRARRGLQQTACKAFRLESIERQTAAGIEPPVKALPCPPFETAAVTLRARDGAVAGAAVRWVIPAAPGRPAEVYRLEVPLAPDALRAPSP